MIIRSRLLTRVLANRLTRAVLFALAVFPLCLHAADRKPNVIFILTDDQNNDTLHCFGGKVLTPAIDKLASQGIKFSRAYAVTSICTPSRYTCLTGQYASRCQFGKHNAACPPGTQANVAFNVVITPQTPNLARALHDAGYATGFVGKWHTGWPTNTPYAAGADMKDPAVAKVLAENQQRLCAYIRSCGFDYAASAYQGNLKDYGLNALSVHNQEWVTKGALDFIEQNKSRPFFLHLCTTLQHSPSPNKSIQGDARYTPAGLLPAPLNVQAPRATIAGRLRQAGVDESLGNATWLDDGIAAVVKKLEELRLADNTAIVFLSDNGTLSGKATCYEGGAHVPAFISWNGHVPAGVTCDKLVANLDFVPTILDICNVKAPPDMKLDGASFLPMVTSKDTTWRDALLLEVGHTRAVVTAKWKYLLLRYPPALQEEIAKGTLGRKAYHGDSVLDLHRAAERAHPAYFDPDQLYNLELDPGEKSNLAKDPNCRRTVAELSERLKQLLGTIPRPFGDFK
jgi:arylsulfatase A-like enzyme